MGKTDWSDIWSWRKQKAEEAVIKSSTDGNRLDKVSKGVKARNANTSGFESLEDYMIQDLYDIFYSKDYQVKLKDDASNWWWYKILSKFDNYQLKPLTGSSNIFSYMVTNHMAQHLAAMFQEMPPEEMQQQLQQQQQQQQGQGQGGQGKGQGQGQGQQQSGAGNGSGNGQSQGNDSSHDPNNKGDGGDGQQDQQQQGQDGNGDNGQQQGQQATDALTGAGKGGGNQQEQKVDSTPQQGQSPQSNSGNGQQQTEAEKLAEKTAQKAMDSLQDFLDKNKESIEEFEEYQKDAAAGKGNEAGEGGGAEIDFGEMEQLKKLNNEIGLNKEHIDAFVKQSIKSFSGYFDKQSKSQYESLLDADIIEEMSGMEMLMIDTAFIDMMDNKFYTSKKKFDVYIDISGSMSSGVNINPQFNSFTRRSTDGSSGKNIPCISLAKILAYKMLRTNMLNDFYIFDDNVEIRDKGKMLSIGLRGGTQIDRVIKHIEKTGLPSVIITDACDSCPSYSPLAYMINVAPHSSEYLQYKAPDEDGYVDYYKGYYQMDKKNQISMFIDNHFLGPGKVKDYMNRK